MTAAVTGHRRRMVRLVSIETAAKKGVFSVLGGRSVGTACYGQTLGSSFHALAAATGNARSPRVDRRVEGTTRDVVTEDR